MLKNNVAFSCFSDTIIMKGNRNQRFHATGARKEQAKAVSIIAKTFCISLFRRILYKMRKEV